MARTKQTDVKKPQSFPRARYPPGKNPPKTNSEIIMARAKAEAERHKENIQTILSRLPKLNVPAGSRPRQTKTKASLKSSLQKKKNMDQMRSALPMLETVAKKKKGYEILLQNPTNDMVTIFCKCARNLLKGNAKLSQTQMSKLAQEKNNIRVLAKPGTSTTQKKNIIKKGGFLPLLAAGALGALAPTLLGGLFGR